MEYNSNKCITKKRRKLILNLGMSRLRLLTWVAWNLPKDNINSIIYSTHWNFYVSLLRKTKNSYNNDLLKLQQRDSKKL